MPIYEYQCEKCGADFEELVSSSASPAPDCPKCGHKHTRRKISAFAFGGGGKKSSPVASGGSCAPSG